MKVKVYHKKEFANNNDNNLSLDRLENPILETAVCDLKINPLALASPDMLERKASRISFSLPLDKHGFFEEKVVKSSKVFSGAVFSDYIAVLMTVSGDVFFVGILRVKQSSNKYLSRKIYFEADDFLSLVACVGQQERPFFRGKILRDSTEIKYLTDACSKIRNISIKGAITPSTVMNIKDNPFRVGDTIVFYNADGSAGIFRAKLEYVNGKYDYELDTCSFDILIPSVEPAKYDRCCSVLTSEIDAVGFARKLVKDYAWANYFKDIPYTTPDCYHGLNFIINKA